MAKKTPLVPILTLATTIFSKLKFKKKPHTLHYRRLDGKWIKKVKGVSKRKCRQTQKELMRLGSDPDRFTILLDGVEPPE